MGVVYADVVARVQQRAAQAAADELRKTFAGVGESLGRDASDNLDNSLRSLLPQVAEQAGVEFMAGFKDEISARIPGVSSSLLDLSTAFRGVGASGAAAGLAAAAGVAAITVAAVKAGEALYGVGERFDGVFDSIAIRTGKAGDDLDALTESISNVATNTASSIEQIGDIGARISQSLSLSGAPLEALTKQIADFNRMTGESLNVRDFGMMLRGFGEDSTQAGVDLDFLTAASQRSGVPVNELISAMKELGPQARSLGLDMNETAGLISAFDQAGIDAGKTVAGLSRAASMFAGNNIELKTGLQDTITQIKGFIDAGNEAAAINLAGKVFGERGGAQKFVDAIRQGKLGVDDLNGSLGNTDGTIAKLNDQTSDWADQWVILKNRVSDLAKEAGGPLFDALNNGLRVLNDMLSTRDAVITSTPAWAAPGTPLTPSQILGGPPPSNTPRSLDEILLPSDVAVPGQVIPPWMTPTPSGADGARTPQDIAGALADKAKAESESTALPPAPQLPYDAAYGQPPAAGETMQQWQARMSNLSAEHDLAERQARLDQLNAAKNATAEDIIAAKNDVVESEMRVWQTEQAYIESRRQKAATAPELPYSADYLGAPRPGQTAQQYSAESSFLEAQRKTAQANQDFEQMQASGTATTAQLADANNTLVEARRAENEAMLRLQGAYVETTEQASRMGDKLGDVGAQLDDDLGISKGLAGLADNLTRFLANLAFAPVLGALRGAQEGSGGYSAQMGSGLLGMAGLSAGMGPPATGGVQRQAVSPMAMPNFGPYAPGYATPQGNDTGGGYASQGTPFGAVPIPGYMGDAALLSHVPSGQYAQVQAADLTQGIGDCTSAIEDLVNIMDGRPTAGREMSTGNAADWLASRGFVPTDAPVPGAFNVGFRHDYATGNGHMEATLPEGMNFNWGGDESAASGGISGAVGAFGDPSFTQHYYRPVSSGDSGGSGGYAPMSSGELTSPGLSSPRRTAGGTGGGIGPGMAGLPQTRFGAAPFAGVGAAAAPSQSVIGGRAWGQGTPASGGIGIGGGGLLGAAGSAISGAAGLATSGAAMGMDGGAGGAVASAAAQIGIQEIQRGISAMGQYAGNAVGGLMETFSLNDSALGDPSKSWLGKIVGVAAGVRPALPNSAGKEGGSANPNMAEAGKSVQAPGPLTPQQAEAQKATDAANAGAGGGNSTTVNNNVNVTNQRATEDYTGQVVQAHLGAQAMAGQPR